MQVLSSNDYKLLKSLFRLTQKGLHKTLNSYLDRKYDTILKTKDYSMAIGNIPVALVAHMDTVFKNPPKNIYYDERQGVLWSPDGLGADDRAGIFAILKILQSGLLPTIIFTTDEESGGLGADSLIRDYPECPTNLKYIIQLDRRGTSDCVFYDCNNKDFIKYVEDFGFIENFGSFSDISIICPEWKIAGVNLSIGYEDEHSFTETLHINPLFSTIAKIKRMLKEKTIPSFKYIPSPLYKYKGTYSKGWYYDWDDEDIVEEKFVCENCKQKFLEYEVIPVVRENGKTVYYCPDCCVDYVEWCEECGEAFEETTDMHVCPECIRKHKEAKKNCSTKKSKKNSMK